MNAGILTKLIGAGLLLLLLAPLAPSSAQAPEIRLMQSRIGTLNDSLPSTEWRYAPGAVESTITVEVVSGSLDPLLELLNLEGEVIASNNDYAPAFSPDARLTVPAARPGEGYMVRVSAVFGAGEYQITALPGAMHRQFEDDFSAQTDAYWDIPLAGMVGDALRLESQLATSDLFTPLGLPPLGDVYLQAMLSFDLTRAETEASLIVRGDVEANGQITGFRLSVAPDGRWWFGTNDVAANETEIASGELDDPIEDVVILGLLAQGERIAAFADGQFLGEVETSTFAADDIWGLRVFDGAVFLDDFWLATPALAPPGLPPTLETWQSAGQLDIANELIAAGAFPTGGERRFVVPNTRYTVFGGEQRNFLVTPESDLYTTFIYGADVEIVEGADVGCGLLAGFFNRDNKLIAFADNQNGAGLFWWHLGNVALNNYAGLTDAAPPENRLLLVRNGRYAGLYVNGTLAAQSIVPLRMGNVGVGFINFADDAATCVFRDVWLWN